MSKILLATGAAMLLATSVLAGPAAASETKQVATANGTAISSDFSARRVHRAYRGYRHYGYRRGYYRPYYGYGYGYAPYYAYGPGPYYYRPYYRPFPFGFFPFF